MEKETVKIRTKKGRIITLTISEKTKSHLYGKDKFGVDTVIPIDEVDSMMGEGDKNE